MDALPRSILFVGSYPADSTHQAMFEMLGTAERAGVPIIAIPDGETGLRGNWSRDENTALMAGHPALREAVPGRNYTGWDDLPEAEIVDPALLTAESLRVRLNYAYHAHEALLCLRGLRLFGMGAEVPLLVGIPAAFDLAMSVLGRAGRDYSEVFRDAIVAHIDDIHELDPNAIVQLETPVALNLVNSASPHLPAALQPSALAEGIAETVARTPQGTRIGLHFCFGDLNNEGRVDEAVAAPSVTFANLIHERLPKGRTLEYVHIPLASGKRPPSLRRDIYTPLNDLTFPHEVRVVAGVAHESQTLPEQQEVLHMVEAGLGRPVDIAAACGLGRRTLNNARLVGRRMIELAKT